MPQKQGKLHKFLHFYNHTSCTTITQHNGIVERKHKHLLEISRALMVHSEIPIPYWGECILTATYLINRFPSRVLQGNTHYALLFNQKTSYNFLRSFGCLWYASKLPRDKGKIQPRAVVCIFLGYHIGQKGYIVLNSPL